MKTLALARTIPWLLIAVCPPLLGHCGGSVEHGTETGNPPVVEQQKLHIVQHGTGVEIVGDPGAVPPGASVSVTNRNTGDRAEVTARADGSLSVSLPGSLQDTYDITVSNRGGSQTVQITTSRDDVTGGTSTGGTSGTNSTSTGGTGGANTSSELSDAELAGASCDALENALGQRVFSGFSAGNTTCLSDEDCVYVNWGAACYYQCGSSFLSTSGATDAAARVLQDTAAVCNELANRCLRQPPSSCPPPATTIPQCAGGVCEALDLATYSCDQLQSSASARLGVLREGTDRGCTQDADCQLVSTSLSCVSDCSSPTAVTTAAVRELTGSISSLDSRFCDEFRNRECPGPFALPCLPPFGTPSASCQAGQCTVSYIPPP